MQISYLANTLPEDAAFTWSDHGVLKITAGLGVHGLPPAVGRAVADAYHKAMKEHLAAASRDKAGEGAGSSQVAPSPSSDVLTGTDWSA